MRWCIKRREVSPVCINVGPCSMCYTDTNRSNVRMHIMSSNRYVGEFPDLSLDARYQPFDRRPGSRAGLPADSFRFLDMAARGQLPWLITEVSGKLGYLWYPWYCRGCKFYPYYLVSYRSSEATALARLSIGRND